MQSNRSVNYQEVSRDLLEEIAKEICLPVPLGMSKKELAESIEKWHYHQEAESSELHRRSMGELRQIAKDKGIPEAWEMNKEQIIAAIKGSRPEPKIIH